MSDVPLQIDPLEIVLANSYRDFHVKGFDYLCLHRSETETVKVYFFDGDVAKLPEVVIPHDHRYPFMTEVLAGRSRNRRYLRGLRGLPGAKPYEAFDYLTPLNGGDGFSWTGTDWLLEVDDEAFEAGDWYTQCADEIHTIQIASDSTVLMLRQLADTVPVGVPTKAYQPEGRRVGPVLDGLYSPMAADHALARIEAVKGLISAGMTPA